MIIGDKFANGGHVMKIPAAMDDGSGSGSGSGPGPSSGGGVGGGAGAAAPNGSLALGEKSGDEPRSQPDYSIPGILHFIQHEWARFELERSQWEVDRAELEARIAFLQGERKGQDNLKNDLVRRIKMLEYALKQERAKFHKLKYGVDLQQGDVKPPPPEDGEPETELPPSLTWRQGRQLIRQYFEEIGYAETVLDVRSSRVRTLLGLNNISDQDENINSNMNGTDTAKMARDSQARRRPKRPTTNDTMVLDKEAVVLANFEFLSGQDMDVDDLVEDLETKQSSTFSTNEVSSCDNMKYGEVDAEAEEVLNELNLLTSNAEDYGVKSDDYGSGGLGGDEESLALGELAQLSVTNEADVYDRVLTKVSFRKTWNAKYTLRSHFDGVRALAFHPVEPVLITASEDHTLKLWNLQKTVSAKKSASLDVEPLYTFRGHQGPVFCLAMDIGGHKCWSGGLDGAVRTWNVPPPTIDPYDAYEPHVMGPTLVGHVDAVWSLAHSHRRLLSASADGTVRLWSPYSSQTLVSTLRSEPDGSPTCVDFCAEGTRAVASFQSAHTVIFDLETGKPVIRLEGEGYGASRVVSHPSSPLTITAHEDRHIRFWDNDTGQLVHSMVAHLDAVTSLAVDPNGLFLLSGSHDCSIRLWNLDNKTCVQEITAHRKKFDESILDVAFHPTRPYIASAGADALAKVFV